MARDGPWAWQQAERAAGKAISTFERLALVACGLFMFAMAGYCRIEPA